MFSRYLTACAKIMRPLDEKVAKEMEALAFDIEVGINKHAIIQHPIFGEMYAYEIDGFGSYIFRTWATNQPRSTYMTTHALLC
ncbi:hypothetical protein LB505_006316 [Fusarium chuoi]|nr:hypothetical protein LB505_006316 [Fusarium chuoi]